MIPRRMLPMCVAAIAMFAASCFDPVHSDAVDALGGEVNGVGPGPLHRPGQPCLLCHGGDGPGSPTMSIGGTIYVDDTASAPSPGVVVRLTDARGHVEDRISNSAGNFYVFDYEWTPVWPVKVQVGATDGEGKLTPFASQMKTLVNSQTSCATCHKLGVQSSPKAMPPVYGAAQ